MAARTFAAVYTDLAILTSLPGALLERPHNTQVMPDAFPYDVWPFR